MKLRTAAGAAGYGNPKNLAYVLDVDDSTVSRWFSGNREPGAVDTCRMMLLFGVGPGDLVTHSWPVARDAPTGTAEALAALRLHDPAGAGGLTLAERIARVEAILLDAPERRPADSPDRPATGRT